MEDVRIEINKKQKFVLGCQKCDGEYQSKMPHFGGYVRLICDKCGDELHWGVKRGDGTVVMLT